MIDTGLIDWFDCDFDTELLLKYAQTYSDRLGQRLILERYFEYDISIWANPSGRILENFFCTTTDIFDCNENYNLIIALTFFLMSEPDNVDKFIL